MRLAWPPPWDLVASALISLLTLVLVHQSSPSMQGFSAPLGLLLVILIPGYLFVLSVFPARSDLGSRRRVLLTLGFAALLAALASLGLILTPRGLQPASLATILSLLALFLTALAYARSSQLPSRKRFTLWSRRGFRSGRRLARLPGPSNKGRIISLFFVLMAIAALAALAFTFNTNQVSSSEKGYTEFNVSWPKEAEYEAASVQMGSKVTALAKIFNHETGSINYTLRLTQNNSSLFCKDLVLGRNESWQGPVSCTLNGPVGRQRLDFMLFKEENLSMPYRQDRLWINLSENKSSMINDSENKPPVTMEQNTKVVVLGIGDDYDGGSGSSVTSQKPASQTDQRSKIDQESEPAYEDGKQVTATEPKKDAGQISGKDSASGKHQQEIAPLEPDLSLPKPESAKGILDSPDKDNKSSENEERRPESAIVSSMPPEDKKADSNSEDSKDSSSPKDGATPGAPADTGETVKSSDSSKTGDASGAKDSGAEQKGDSSKISGVGKEIDSWVSTRGMGSGSSEKGHDAYESKNIKYVKGSKGERAVLGRSGANPVRASGGQSKKPVKLG